ncbi:DphB [Acrasis kona]
MDMRPEEDHYNKITMALIMAQGLKLQTLQRQGHHLLNEALETADYITALTSSATFSFCLFIVTQAVGLAMITYMQNIEQGLSDQNVLMEQLRKCVRAMHNMSNKYKLAPLRYGQFLSQVENILKIFDDRKSIDLNAPVVLSKSDFRVDSYFVSKLVGCDVQDSGPYHGLDLDSLINNFLENDPTTKGSVASHIQQSGGNRADQVLFI